MCFDYHACLGDAGVGASCRHAHASGPQPLIPHPVRGFSTVACGTGKYCLLISHLIHHQSRHKPSIHDSLHISHRATVPLLPCTQCWTRARRTSPSLQHRRHAEKSEEGDFSVPRPPSHSSSAASVAAPCVGAWVSRLLPTLGHVAHGPVSSIDETRQPRVSSIARRAMGRHHLSRTDGGARSLVGQLDYELNST